MIYEANPVRVTAHRITSVGPPYCELATLGAFTMRSEHRDLTLDNGEKVIANAGMLARFVPQPGDYWVIQEDGYTYLNPKDVFERKYSPLAKARE